MRCRSVLYRGSAADLTRMAAITLGAAIVFLIAQLCPIVELELNGIHSTATLGEAIGVLWSQQLQAVALGVLLFTIVFPAIELSALLYVTLSLRAGFRPPGMHRLLRAAVKARQWGMTEVLMLGILITIVKMSSKTIVTLQPGMFAFGALTVMLAIVTSFDPRRLWRIADELVRPAPVPPRYTRIDAQTPALACHACGLVCAESGARRQHCARCGSTLHRRQPHSIMRTWALLVAAAILYIPANVLIVMHSRTLLGGQDDDTIISGVVYFWNTGSQALAVIIFIASIVVPVAKLAALTVLAYTAQRRSQWRPYQRTVLYRLLEVVGRWSMLDIFVIALSVALVRFSTLAEMKAGPGALAFCSVVVLTMLASMQFDPRLIWDPVKHSGEPHA